MASRCWNTGPDDERDELLPRKMAALQPKTEGSLRRRLLSARIYQHHCSMWGANAGGAADRPGSPPVEEKPLPPHLQYPGSWYRAQHLPPRPHIHPSFAPEAHGKIFFTPETHGKPYPQSPLLQQQRCSILTQRRRTSSCPPTPEPRPGYTLPASFPLKPPPPLGELQGSPQYRYQTSRKRRSRFFCFRRWRGRKSGLEATQATPLLQRGTDRNCG